MKKMICQEKRENFIFVDGEEYFVNSETGELQRIFRDYSATGKERPWRKHKIENQLVETCYRMLAEKETEQKKDWEERANRLHNCGMHLFFNWIRSSSPSAVCWLTASSETAWQTATWHIRL